MSRIAILGAGMAGFGAAYRLHAEGVRALMFEQRAYHGGHTASFRHDSGFIFDDGPHISFTKVDRIRQLFAESVEHKIEDVQARVNNYWKGHWVKHPVQCNLHGLPAELVVRILTEAIEAKYKEQPAEIHTYAEWLVASFGPTFAETFPMTYGLKYHTTSAGNMSTDWLGPRLYRPDLAELLRGALSPDTSDAHYITSFRYPSRGGFVSFLNGFLPCAGLRLGHRLDSLDPVTRMLRFSNGEVFRYDHLISSVPLPELIARIDGAPPDVIEAAGRLACTTCVVVNLGLDRADISEAHWSYFYDHDFCFTRVSFPHMLSPHNVPPGSGSIQAELYYSEKYRPFRCRPEDLIQPVIGDLRRCGLIRNNDRILFKNATLSPYANVIFDLERRAALEVVHGYLDDLGVAYCGRYGDWAYHWTDEAFMSGEQAAQKVLDRLCSEPVASALHWLQEEAHAAE